MVVLNDCNYDKTKLIHEMSRIVHFINKHAIEDAHKTGHPLCAAAYKEAFEDLKKAIHKLREAVSGLAKEGKY